MEKIIIRNHQELLARIQVLRQEKIMREEELKISVREFVTSLNPLLLIKDSLHQLANDKEVRLDLGKVGLNIATSFIFDRLLGRQGSVKGFLSSLLMEKLAALTISKNGTPIIEGLRKWIRPASAVNDDLKSSFNNR